MIALKAPKAPKAKAAWRGGCGVNLLGYPRNYLNSCRLSTRNKYFSSTPETELSIGEG